MGVGVVAQLGATSTGCPERLAEVSNSPQALARSISAPADENKGRCICQSQWSHQHKEQAEQSHVMLPAMHGLVLHHQAEPSLACHHERLFVVLAAAANSVPPISGPQPEAGSCTQMLLCLSDPMQSCSSLHHN